MIVTKTNDHHRLHDTARYACGCNGTCICVDPPHIRSHRQLGLSLIELMIALLISSLIMVGLVQIFSSTRATYQTDEGLARLQENGRFAMDFLTRDIRMAGNLGCLGRIPPASQRDRVWPYLKYTSSAYDLTQGISGFEARGTAPGDTFAMPAEYPATLVSNTAPALDSTLLPGGAVSGSDVLVVRYMDSDYSLLVPNAVGVYQDGTQIYVGTNNFTAKEVLMVTDCSRAAIFAATKVNSGPPISIEHDTSLNRCGIWGDKSTNCQGPPKSFGNGSQIAAFRGYAYYVGAGANGVPALFRQDVVSGTPVELVEGVENMQVLYGVDSDGDNSNDRNGRNADTYYTADKIPTDPATGLPNWASVVSVRIGLLLSTSNVSGPATETTKDVSTYDVTGVTLDPQDDNRRRRVFVATVRLRNP